MQAHGNICNFVFLTVYIVSSLIFFTLIQSVGTRHVSWLVVCALVFLSTGVVHALLIICVRLHRKLHDAKKQVASAEKALIAQRKRLKLQLKERTAQLNQLQIEEMRQMYRFAELGQLGVTLLHDLANHLAALTLEIEGIQSKQRSKDIDRAREIIRYLENIVENTRERLHATPQNRPFNIVKEVDDVVNFLRFKAARADAALNWQPPAKIWTYTGDATRLCQVIAIIISNAIDAYSYTKGDSTPKTRQVAITIQRTEKHMRITISDWGKGIPKSARKLLFKPFHSTKKSGLGLGLFIAKQTIETHFSGSITLGPATDHTEFTIELPLGGVGNN